MLPDEILQVLTPYQLVRVAVPLPQGPPLHLEGLARLLSPDSLEVYLLNDPLEAFAGAATQPWAITCDLEICVFSLRAISRGRCEGGGFILELVDYTPHHHRRRYHRVDTEIYLDFWPAAASGPTGRIKRTQVNLSGCGLRFAAAQPLAERERLGLELALPGPSLEVVRCLGSVRRSEKRRDEAHDIVIDLHGAGKEQQDRIASFCLAEHFRQMQSKMRRLASIYAPTLEALFPGDGMVRNGDSPVVAGREEALRRDGRPGRK